MSITPLEMKMYEALRGMVMAYETGKDHDRKALQKAHEAMTAAEKEMSGEQLEEVMK